MAQLQEKCHSHSILGGIIGNLRENFNIGHCSNAAFTDCY
jgi:hypothetical protein